MDRSHQKKKGWSAFLWLCKSWARITRGNYDEELEGWMDDMTEVAFLITDNRVPDRPLSHSLYSLATLTPLCLLLMQRSNLLRCSQAHSPNSLLYKLVEVYKYVFSRRKRGLRERSRSLLSVKTRLSWWWKYERNVAKLKWHNLSHGG